MTSGRSDESILPRAPTYTQRRTRATMKARILLRRVERPNLGGLLAAIVAISGAVGAWHSLPPLFGAWSQPEYSHAWLILPLALLVFAHRFQAVDASNRGTPGVLIALLAVLLMLFGWAAGSYTAAIDGTILGFIGFVWASIGTSAIKRVVAPLIYLFFMVPLPLAFYISVSAEMQLLSSKLGMILISLLGVQASLDGNIIILPSARLEVADACSGLRYLFPLVGFAFLIAMLLEDHFWKKATILLSSVPIAVVLNAGRIAMIAVLLDRFGIDTSTGSSHALEGFAVFFLCIVLLFLEVQLLLGIGSSRGRLIASDLLELDRDKIAKLLSWPTPPTSILAAAILLVGGGVVASIPVRVESVPYGRPFALFPMEFAGWRGTPKALDGEALKALGLTDYVLADYTRDANPGDPGSTGAVVNFYVAYYASQRNGLHAHSPQLCIPGGGWSIIKQSIVAMPWRDGQMIPINRVVVEKRNVRQLVYYWFEERGRHIAAESTLKYYALRDALLENRSDGALVRIVVTVNGEDEEVADSAAQKLAWDTSPLLESYVSAQGQQ
jgi:exosortase D (VPLPA-CTERM-specific)